MRIGFVRRERLPSRGGVWGIVLPTGDEDGELPPEGARASLCAWNGFRKTVFCFFGADVGFVIGEAAEGAIGLIDRLTGTKFSSSSWTKLEGNNPTMRRSLRSRPVHH